MPLTHAQALRQIEAAEAVRRAAHNAERTRQSRSGYGCDLGPFVPMSAADKHAEAARRVAGWNSPEAVMKRRLIALATAGVDGAYATLTACDRGDAGCWERAAEFVARADRVAA